MTCLDDATVDDFLSGRLDESHLRWAEGHLDGCADCHALVSTLARAEDSAPSTIGRYAVERELGRGAMGVVYLARDPDLDRCVALKVIRDRAERAARLLREAQTMARLAHPNVATVYEVGCVEPDVYLSMEYVAGRTLRAWLEEERPRQDRIREVVAQIGSGLAAAHQAGIVHRDLKPENVIVGDDGRVRVTDFGLAALPTEPGADHARLVGTPAYMAPEQLEGDEATAHSDQFALAVCAFEASTGTRPFTGSTPAELRAAIERGLEPSRLAAVPSSLRRPIARALAFQPDRRFPSVDAFVREIVPGRTRSRRLVSAGVVVALAASSAAFLTSLARPTPKPEADPRSVCLEGAARVTGVWNDRRAARIAGAFAATASPIAGASADRVRPVLAAWASDWQAGFVATCEATQVRGEQSPTILDARMRCLDRRLASFDALVSSFEAADAQVVLGAPAAALALPDVGDCANVEALFGADPRPTDPGAAAEVDAIEGALAALRATSAARPGEVSLDLTLSLVARARASGHRPTVAEAELVAARVHRGAGDLVRAREHADAAQTIAEAARADATAARAWLEVLAVEGAGGRFAEVERDSTRAAAAISRVGDPPALVAGLALARGLALTSLGRLDDATRELERAQALYQQAPAADPTDVTRAIGALADVARLRGDLVQALALHERALAADQQAFGAEHPAVARHHHNVAGVLRLLGRPEDALRAYERAKALESLLGAEHPSVGLTENSMGLVLLDLGRPVEARERLGRASAILEAARSPERALALVNLARADRAAGRHDAAVRSLDDAIVILMSTAGRDSLPLAGARWARALSLRALGRPEEAAAEAREAARVAGLFAEDNPEAARLAAEADAALRAPARQRAPGEPASAKPPGSLSYGAAKSWDPD
ncbi:MAG: protein kinase [Myxococcales bacterium]|nr:protein kinase [Myxococcales bacterium]